MIGVKRNRNKDSPYVPNRPLTRVELHVHLDGGVRHETIWELAKEKKIKLPGRGTFEEFKDYSIVQTPRDLAYFLSKFDIILASIKGDLKAIERVAYEFAEDASLSGILYSEARFCPHIIIPDDVAKNTTGDETEGKKWVWDVTGALIKGLQRGQADFGSNVNLVATCIRGYPTRWYEETLELAADKDFHQGRVIAIDIAALPDTQDEKFMLEPEAISIFDRAQKLGIHRTVHAGESGQASQVTNALDILHAERIGHGYRILQDPLVYNRISEQRIHLECCPWSSLLTGSVPSSTIPHPIIKFFEDNINVSVNTDDPTVTGTKIDDEYRLLSNWGLSDVHYVRGTFNAARSCFLPQNEKDDLIQNICKTYGFSS